MSGLKSVIAHVEEGDPDKTLAFIPGTDEARLPVGVPNLPTYLFNNRDRMNYNALQEKGLKVVSGAIESSNKR
ncbi:MAG TPA: hypothetical protein VLH18_03070 [Candidatus Limnocylindrales bacterium]|nr:hypothetical protein [Candidatus Limnocylindrales bacterium]